MTEKLYYAKSELIEERLKAFPQEANDPDLEHNATAGYVYNPDTGLYIHFGDWEVIRRNNEEESNRKTQA